MAPTPPVTPKPGLGQVIVSDANGVLVGFSGFLGKFGAQHPRLLAALSFVAGLATASIAGLFGRLL